MKSIIVGNLEDNVISLRDINNGNNIVYYVKPTRNTISRYFYAVKLSPDEYTWIEFDGHNKCPEVRKTMLTVDKFSNIVDEIQHICKNNPDITFYKFDTQIEMFDFLINQIKQQ